MSILGDQAAADMETVMDDWADSVTLNDGATPSPHVYVVSGVVFRVGVTVDPGTGLPVPGNTCSVTVRLSDLGNVIPAEGWSVTTTDVTGATVAGKVKNVMPDRSLGVVTFQVRVT